jgi:hypothetical protein
MAVIVVPNEGLLLWAEWAFVSDSVAVEDLVIDLYQNAYTPVDTSTGTDFTVATFAGYTQLSLPRADNTTITAALGVATIVSTVTVTWTSTDPTPQTVYGWYARGVSSGKVVAALEFDSPRTLSNGAIETLGPMTWQMSLYVP